jgi:cytochrome d ubiquinol oxidase subunit II
MVRCTTAAWVAFLVFCLLATVSTFFAAPFLVKGIWANPLLWILLALLFSAMVYIPTASKAGKHLRALLASALTIASLIGVMGLSLYPRMVPSSLDVANHSPTIYNASSSSRTLTVMLIIALVGMPLVIAYTALIYTLFMGKVVPTKEGY